MELACLSLEELGFSETVYETTKPQQRQLHGQQSRGKGRQQQQQQAEDSCDRDARSVYVSNLASSTSRDQLTELFGCCGDIRCVTIPRSQQPQAHAYIEFATAAEAAAAVKMHRQVSVKGRVLSVNAKRSNIRGCDVLQGHVGQVGRRGRRGNISAAAGSSAAAVGGPPFVSFGPPAAAFPSWGPPPFATTPTTTSSRRSGTTSSSSSRSRRGSTTSSNSRAEAAAVTGLGGS
ncbi:hypothetical protein COO60DRAFT_453388 [Scenedesmus sp. NREL 46B-D3]|nr:hypothetical protein COO60DRAFT_453388 [Scenedesmus sp. NREL 46B-D3]